MGKRSLPVFKDLRSTGKLRLPMAPISQPLTEPHWE